MEDNDRIMTDSDYSVAIPKPDGYNLRGLQWTTEPPTQKGWYWVTGEGIQEPFCCWALFDDSGRMYIDGNYINLRMITRWLGPLPEPPIKGE